MLVAPIVRSLSKRPISIYLRKTNSSDLFEKIIDENEKIENFLSAENRYDIRFKIEESREDSFQIRSPASKFLENSPPVSPLIGCALSSTAMEESLHETSKSNSCEKNSSCDGVHIIENEKRGTIKQDKKPPSDLIQARLENLRNLN